MIVDIIEDVNPRHLRPLIAEEDVNKAQDEFKNKEKEVFPRVGVI